MDEHISNLKEQLNRNGFDLYDTYAAATARGIRGHLATVRCPGSLGTDLIWVKSDGSRVTVQTPLSRLDRGWDFLHIERVGDFTGGGTLDALIVGIGGAGMYYHYPILLQLTAQGEWKVYFSPQEPYFYGTTEVLDPAGSGTVRIAVTSVDRKAPWIFPDCSLCNHPFKRDILAIREGGLHLEETRPVPDVLRTLANFVYHSWQQRFDSAMALLAPRARIGASSDVRTPEDLKTALQGLGLLETAGGLCYLRREKTAGIATTEIQGRKVVILGSQPFSNELVHFVCSAGEREVGYVAEIPKQGEGFFIQWMDAWEFPKGER